MSCQGIEAEAGRRKKKPFLFFLENDSQKMLKQSRVTLNQTQNWCCFVLNFTNPINKKFMTLIYFKRIQVLKIS